MTLRCVLCSPCVLLQLSEDRPIFCKSDLRSTNPLTLNKFISTSLKKSEFISFLIQGQNCPRIDGNSPSAEPFVESTLVTVVGGGFSINECKVDVFFGKCIDTHNSNLENIACNAAAPDISTSERSAESSAILQTMVWSHLERAVEQATNSLFTWVLLGIACVRSPKVS